MEHGLFQQRLPSRSLTLLFRMVAEFFILHCRLPVCRVRQIKGVFALFSEGKSATLGPHSGSELGCGHQLIHAGGSAGGFLHGCSWCVDAVSRWLVGTSVLGPRCLAAWVKAGTGSSTCVSLRLLFERISSCSPVFVLAQFALGIKNIISFVLASGSHCSGRLGIADNKNTSFGPCVTFVLRCFLAETSCWRPFVMLTHREAARRRQRRLRQWLRHERLSVAMALAENNHHTALRRQTMARAGEGREMHSTAVFRKMPSPRRLVPGTLRWTPGRTWVRHQPPSGQHRCLRCCRRCGFSGAPWSRSSTLCWWSQCSMFLCRRWWNSWWTFSHLSISALPSRLSMCPRSCVHPALLAQSSASRRRWTS